MRILRTRRCHFVDVVITPEWGIFESRISITSSGYFSVLLTSLTNENEYISLGRCSNGTRWTLIRRLAGREGKLKFVQPETAGPRSRGPADFSWSEGVILVIPAEGSGSTVKPLKVTLETLGVLQLFEPLLTGNVGRTG